MKLLAGFCLLCSLVFATDARFTWLPTQTNVIGVPDTFTGDTTFYGVEVFMDSDNPAISEFSVSATVRLSSGEIRTFTGTVPRAIGKFQGVKYSTGMVVWVDTSQNFEVLAIEVKASTRQNVTKPIAGKDYATGAPTQ